MSQNILRSLRAPRVKATKSEITVGRILILGRCPTTVCAANSSEPTTQSKAPPARDRLCCDRLMYPSRRAKSVGSTISSDIKSFFGTWIRLTGNDRGRLWFAIEFSKKHGRAQSCCPTTFTRGRSKPCRQLSMHLRRKVLNSSPYQN